MLGACNLEFMFLYGIAAHPVEHSLSPLIHNALFKHFNIDAIYEKFDVDKEDLPEFLNKVRKENIAGLSVSVPNKQEIMKYLDEVDDVALKIGAVNTVINKNGRLFGTNTDYIGALRAVETCHGMFLRGRKILVIGAGGAARAVVYGLKNEGAEIFLTNRTIENAEQLAKDFDVHLVGYENFRNLQIDIIINTTTVGMQGESKNLSPYPAEFFQKDQIVMDIVYKPLMTKFLKDAKEKGCQIITGEKMLIYQALEQFELWTGKKADLDFVKGVLKL